MLCMLQHPSTQLRPELDPTPTLNRHLRERRAVQAPCPSITPPPDGSSPAIAPRVSRCALPPLRSSFCQVWSHPPIRAVFPLPGVCQTFNILPCPASRLLWAVTLDLDGPQHGGSCWSDGATSTALAAMPTVEV